MACQGTACVLTKKGLLAKSILGFGSVKCKLGGNTLCLRARIVFIKPAIPAAASKCPMFVFTEPMAQNFFYCFCLKYLTKSSDLNRISKCCASPVCFDIGHCLWLYICDL